MNNIVYSTSFKKDFKKARKFPLSDLKTIFDIISSLESNTPAEKYRDHDLTGNWAGFRECHVKPDLLLIYRISNNELQLIRLGSHSDLF
jgi:mRNA interferase YafQ